MNPWFIIIVPSTKLVWVYSFQTSDCCWNIHYIQVYPHVSFYVHLISQGLLNVPIEHHPTIGDISSPTDIWFGDVKKIPKKGHQSQPLYHLDPRDIPMISIPLVTPRPNGSHAELDVPGGTSRWKISCAKPLARMTFF